MPVTTKQKTALAIIVGAVVTIAPTFFGYLKARDEIAAKREESRSEAEAGYRALSESVKGLQKTALEQHDFTVKLEAQIGMLVTVLAQPPGSGSGGSMRLTSLPTIEPTPARPELPAPPDFDVAQRAKE